MSEDLKDILGNLNPDIDQETLLRYLQGKLSAEEQHEVEKQMLTDDFESDALDGLQNFSDKKSITGLVEQLNKELKRKTEKKKRFRQKWQLELNPWTIIAIVLILAMAVIGFILVYRKLKGQ
jgi:DNA primase